MTRTQTCCADPTGMEKVHDIKSNNNAYKRKQKPELYIICFDYL